MPILIKLLVTAFFSSLVAFNDKVQEFIVGLFAEIPVPMFLSNISTNGLPSNTIFLLDLFQISYGLTVVSSALILRFTIKFFMSQVRIR